MNDDMAVDGNFVRCSYGALENTVWCLQVGKTNYRVEKYGSVGIY